LVSFQAVTDDKSAPCVSEKSGRISPFRQALDCRLVEDLLTYLASSSLSLDNSARALIVHALKSMQDSLQHGEQVSAILRSNPVWRQYEAQRHDLFIKNDSGMGALTNQMAPGVAGYLTSTAKPAPMQPPPLEAAEENGGGVNNNPLL
jgi:hypothetical protein